jgi:hypothetical protein
MAVVLPQTTPQLLVLEPRQLGRMAMSNMAVVQAQPEAPVLTMPAGVDPRLEQAQPEQPLPTKTARLRLLVVATEEMADQVETAPVVPGLHQVGLVVVRIRMAPPQHIQVAPARTVKS